MVDPVTTHTKPKELITTPTIKTSFSKVVSAQNQLFIIHSLIQVHINQLVILMHSDIKTLVTQVVRTLVVDMAVGTKAMGIMEGTMVDILVRDIMVATTVDIVGVVTMESNG